jgi:hypothetical protein
MMTPSALSNNSVLSRPNSSGDLRLAAVVAMRHARADALTAASPSVADGWGALHVSRPVGGPAKTDIARGGALVWGERGRRWSAAREIREATARGASAPAPPLFPSSSDHSACPTR